MSFIGEFAEILEKKLGKEPKASHRPAAIRSEYSLFEAVIPTSSDHRNFQFIGSVEKRYPKVDVKKAPRKEPQQTKAKVVVNKTKENLISVLKLSEKAQKAYFLLIRLGAEFEDGKIGKSLLKSEYRRLAKIYHPDNQLSSSSSKKFNYLHTCNKILIKALSSIEKSNS